MAKDLTVAEKLKNMYELQTIDSELSKIEVLKGELPMEVDDLEDEIEGLETRIRKMEHELDDINDERSRHEANIREANALIERYDRQLNDVKNDREYDALTKELEMQKLEIQLSEKRIGEAEVKFRGKDETLKSTVERRDQKIKDLETKRVELKEIIADTEKEEDKLRKRSTKARKSIEDRLLKPYDKIRRSYRNGLAVVTVERDSCGGCFNKIPPQVQLEITQRKKIIACEHCGRILVDDYIMDVGKEKPAEAK